MIDFVKSKLASKKTDELTFNYNFLNEEIPKIINSLRLNMDRHYEVNKEELVVIDKVKDNLLPFRDSLEEI